MIITITDHFNDAFETLAHTGESNTTSLAVRVATDQHQQPASFIVVSKDTMNEILVELAKRGHVVVGQGIK